MGITAKVSIIDHSVSGKCGKGRDNWGKGVAGEEGKEKKGKRENRRKIGEEKGKWHKRGLSKLIFTMQ
jgi:hypothetical protein